MSSFLRLSLLATCGAAGVALAICLALGSPARQLDESPKFSEAPKFSPDGDITTAPEPLANAVTSVLPGPPSVLPSNPQCPKTQASSPPSPTAATANPLEAAPRWLAPQPAVTQQALPQNRADLMKMITPEVRDELNKLLAEQRGSSEDLPAPDSQKKADSTLKILSPAEGALPGDKPPAKKAVVHNKPQITRVPGEGDDHLAIHFQDADLREVLEMLSEQGGLNILPSGSVRGKVTASLNDVNIDTALDVILRTTGFTSRRDGQFIYVGTAQDFQGIERSLDRIGTRLYRPNYVRAAELQALITPLLTQGVGAVSVTTPAETGIAADNAKAGGDNYGGGDTILVKDYEAVLVQVDQIAHEIDKRPLQVAIEAMLLSVKLDDDNQFGVDFQLLRNKKNIALGIGSPASSIGNVDFSSGGLKFGFLDSSLGTFLTALETIGKTDVIATPRLMCLNKQKAEILIGSQLGYISSTVTETSTSQSVQFLEVGTQLRIRPFISSDGSIRMEVHPELSTGTVTVQNQITLPEKDVTQVTTNVMTRDGCTVIIGGLLRDDLSTTTTQVPFFGSLPGVGWLFRHKEDKSSKSEILVLITPHLVYDPDSAIEGTKGASDFHERHATYADHMSPIGFDYLGRKYLHLAEQAYSRGDVKAATRFVNLSIHFNPQCREAIELRDTIWHGGVKPVLPCTCTAVGASPLDGAQIAPWLLHDLEHGDNAHCDSQHGDPKSGRGDSMIGPPPIPPILPCDQGVPGQSIHIVNPQRLQ